MSTPGAETRLCTTTCTTQPSGTHPSLTSRPVPELSTWTGGKAPTPIQLERGGWCEAWPPWPPSSRRLKHPALAPRGPANDRHHFANGAGHPGACPRAYPARQLASAGALGEVASASAGGGMVHLPAYQEAGRRQEAPASQQTPDGRSRAAGPSGGTNPREVAPTLRLLEAGKLR